MAAPARKPGLKDTTQWLSAAECATRTGLTVRALRVYERQGLITPPRSAKGWRRYGTFELTRLNTIVMLKALGLTLLQIKTVLADDPPTLAHLLQVHAESWREKRATAARALVLVEAAQERLRAQETLSIDELCDLIQRLETNRSVNVKTSPALIRELINEHTTPEEERTWATWWAEHPDDALEAQAFRTDQQALMAEARRLQEHGEDPASPPVQALVVQWNEQMARYHIRERNSRQMAWNLAITSKWMGIGVKMQRLSDEGRGAQMSDFWMAAMRESRWGKAMRKLMLEIRETAKTQTDPASAAFDEPVERLHTICVENGLGETLVIIGWRRFTGPLFGPYTNDDLFDPEWEFMERAVKARPTPSLLTLVRGRP